MAKGRFRVSPSAISESERTNIARASQLDQLHKSMLANPEGYELDDILEEVTGSTVKRVVTENVEYELKRKGLMKEGQRVVIPEGGYDYNLDDQGGVSGNWELFDRDQNTVLAQGSVVGSISAGELLFINTNITQVMGFEDRNRTLRSF